MITNNFIFMMEITLKKINLQAFENQYAITET